MPTDAGKKQEKTMNDNLNQILTDTRRTLERLRRRRIIADQTQLRVAVGECMQNLEKCKVSLARNAFQQSKDVRDAMRIGADTEQQKVILRSSAMGYLVADEALLALRTVAGQDDLNRAYDVLDSIIQRIGSTDSGIGESGKVRKDGFGVRHTAAPDVTSQERLTRHKAMVDSFFAELIRTGELETLIAAAREKAYAKSLEELTASASESDAAEPEEPDVVEVEEPDIVELDEPDLAPVPETEKEKPKTPGKMFSKPTLGKSRKG